MRLQIENVGRVKKADIEIRGITVVAGSNGAGKSTVSKSLYSILEMSDDVMHKAQEQKERSLQYAVERWREKNVLFLLSSAQAFLEKVQEIYVASKSDQEFFCQEMIDYISDKTPSRLLDFEKAKKALPQLFQEYRDILEKQIGYYVRYASQVVLDNVFQGQINCLKNREESKIIYDNGDTHIGVRVLRHKISDAEIDGGTVRPVYITTPQLIDSIRTYRELNVARHNGTVPYFNVQLMTLLKEKHKIRSLVAEEYNKIEEQGQLLQKLFREVFEGELRLDGNRIAYYDRWCEEDIELSNIASGMKIFLILQTLVMNGVFLEDTCLIIDEPETNLHPEWQLKLAHLLVLLNKNIGIQIYLNSHSPYFVRAVEYYADQYQCLEQCSFYIMEKDIETGMCHSECVTEQLGVIYDKMAEPFNKIM